MQCFIPEEFYAGEVRYDFLQVPDKLHILYEDEALLIVDKPKGLLAHKDAQGIQDNLTDRILHYLYAKKEYDPAQAQSFTPALCHRIDRNTRGIVIAAKTAQALRCMNEKIAHREVQKTYLCLAEGHFTKKQDVITLYHKKLDSNQALLSETPQEGYHKCVTGYRVLDEKRNVSLVEVDLHTGKSHQIRAVMSYLHHPLIGDVKYGAHKTKEKSYQALCAWKIQFAFTTPSILDALNGKSWQLPKEELFPSFYR